MKKKILIVVLLFVAITGVMALRHMKDTPAAEPPTDVTAQGPLPRLLDLGARACIPCKAMAPILDEMKETFAGQLDVVFIDVWETKGVSEEYGIRMIPTQIFFDPNGQELFRHEGFFAREEMLARWKELGFDFTEAETL